MLVGLVALGLLLVAFGSRISDALDDRSLVLIGLILAIVPTLLWLGVFRELDRLEPEPHQYLLSVMILAALLTGTIAEPLAVTASLSTPGNPTPGTGRFQSMP